MALELVNKLPYDHPYRWDGTLFGGPKLWRPDELGASLAVWLDAADASTITLNGTTVSQWRDKSGNERHAAQETAANQPSYGTTVFNGRPGIAFNGTTNFLNTLDVAYTTQAIAIAFRRTNSTSFVCGFGDLNAAILHTTAEIRIRSASNRSFSNATFENFILTGDVNEAYRNGSALAFLGVSTSAMTRQIGARSGQVYYPGEIAEIVVLGVSLSTADRQRLEGYLAWKWGLEANLPAGHPFKNTPPTL